MFAGRGTRPVKDNIIITTVVCAMLWHYAVSTCTPRVPRRVIGDGRKNNTCQDATSPTWCAPCAHVVRIKHTSCVIHARLAIYCGGGRSRTVLGRKSIANVKSAINPKHTVRRDTNVKRRYCPSFIYSKTDWTPHQHTTTNNRLAVRFSPPVSLVPETPRVRNRPWIDHPWTPLIAFIVHGTTTRANRTLSRDNGPMFTFFFLGRYRCGKRN